MEFTSQVQADFINVSRQKTPAVHRFARAARINDFAHASDHPTVRREIQI
jgi:hypothetical protein